MTAVDVALPSVLAVREYAGTPYVWRHGAKHEWRREGQDVVFYMPDGHPEWQAAADRVLNDLMQDHPQASSICVRGPTGLALCGYVRADQ